ncbi:MAG: acyl-ACP--UDP-N-acetylglucosamine O-acyltransferase [Spirochaetia bacterium]|nr:acyl-ACP--UDP-N-acetylglucosamine O-acyltransferase [Spirochaetota bacterium]MCX8096386.1 acyl-ACP--UDP-N-acetylglucosamine O-acyltransferase [Spirochaetota bacterium]MDW8112962.1 acyl-ACP--UDP-N-acetylglucosamine O-acyltransferase [Spirochaetia bacterium]
MPKIHHTAIIEGNVNLGSEVEIGPYAVIKGNVIIGDGSILEIGSCIYGNVKIGNLNKIGPYAVIGSDPQDLKYKGEEVGFIEIGNENTIREFVTIHKPTSKDSSTKIGNKCLLMVGSHIAHDCVVGDEVVLVNNCLLAGFSVVEDGAFISALIGIHQYARVGKYVMIGALSKVVQDIPPFTMALGNHAEVVGINSVGLRRRNFTPEQRNRIKEAYKIIYKSEYTIRDAAKVIVDMFPDDPNIKYISDFILSSKRGIAKGLRTEEEGIVE